MAKTEERKWPVAKYQFRVTIAGEVFSFQEATGLQAESPIIEYRVGGKEIHTMKLTGLLKTSNLILKKGIFDGDKALRTLFDPVYLNTFTDETNKFDILVELLSESGAHVMDWNIKQACPIKFTGTDLKSTENAIAIETMEFSYEEILTT